MQYSKYCPSLATTFFSISSSIGKTLYVSRLSKNQLKFWYLYMMFHSIINGNEWLPGETRSGEIYNTWPIGRHKLLFFGL